MPRQPKPFYRKQTKSWYCSVGGRQIPLGKNRDAAHTKFHELMADREQVKDELTTLYELSQAYLDWCEANRKPATYQLHKRYLKSFIDSVGRRMRPSQLRVHHVSKWHEGLAVGTTTQNDVVGIVQRMLNWAVEQEYLYRNPIKRMKKPKRKRRDVFYTPEQWKLIRENVPGPLGELLDFLYLTGCRPLEARTIEARHLHDDLVIFPTDESKGEHEARVIYLVPEAKAILARLAKDRPTGILFRNTRGRPWTKNAIILQLTRVSKTVGFRVIAYGARHSFATEALTKGGVDPISVAHLMGHKDPTMVSRVYSHIARNPDFLRQQALKAIGKKGA
ncbi:tyrosine-type recombinase/integrase [Blastopirellula retiformator]|uniref:Tyrosine recombinase XerD n=1 Tax=Blastopirellula retiformator TaxID=2527970 RepID=A0A5C5V8K8_9BACT|nr:tyrosine-type recombinase/integrase [Blastopirellula retiformator]TWT34916.1 Tyrosine recombinase XerD [Blastopirellula retiformator]